MLNNFESYTIFLYLHTQKLGLNNTAKFKDE